MEPVTYPRAVGNLEKSMGLELFQTSTEGVGGHLRETWNDFHVIEMFDQHRSVLDLAKQRTRTSVEGHQKFWHFVVEKRGVETLEAITRLARALQISRGAFAHSGNKDKKALTVQLLSVRGDAQPLAGFDTQRIRVLEMWPMPKPVGLGSHWGNRFKIIIRKITLDVDEVKSQVDQLQGDLSTQGGLVNLFGHQRFGVQRPITHEVGRHIIQDDFEGAVKNLVAQWDPSEGADALEARQRIQQQWNPKQALSYFPQRLNVERIVLEHLVQSPDDYAGALLQLHPKLGIMFIHGIQGYLFNRLLCARLKLGYSLSVPIEDDLVASIDARGMPMKMYTRVTSRNIEKAQKAILNGQAEIVAPLLGYGSQIPRNSWGDAMTRILKEEHLELDAFRVPKCRFFESSGSYRPIRVVPTNVSFEIQEDERNPGYRQVEAKFDLGKGSYATVLLREVMKTAPEYYV